MSDSNGGRHDMTAVVVEVVASRHGGCGGCGGVFDDASTIGSGDGTPHEGPMDSSWVKCPQQDGGGVGYCCPRHPEQRKTYKPHRNSICPECLRESQLNRSTLEDRKRLVEHELQRLLSTDSNGKSNGNAGTGPSRDDDEEVEAPEWLRGNNSDSIPNVGVALQDWTKGLQRRREAEPNAGAVSAPRVLKEEEYAGAQAAPPPPPSHLLQRQRQLEQHPPMHHGAQLPQPPPPMTTHGPYPYAPSPYYYEPSAPGGGSPHPTSQPPPPPYPTSASSTATTSPTLPPAGPTHPYPDNGWNPPSYGAPGSAPMPNAADAYAARLHQMMEWQDAMMVRKIQECDELRRSLEGVTEEIRTLQVDNAQLRWRVDQQGDQMRQELGAIRREMAGRAALAVAEAAASPSAANTQHVHRTSPPERDLTGSALPRRRSPASSQQQQPPRRQPAPGVRSQTNAPAPAAAGVVLRDGDGDDDEASYNPGAERLEPRWKSSSTTTTSASSPWFPFPSMDETDCLSSIAVEEGFDHDSNDPFGVGGVVLDNNGKAPAAATSAASSSSSAAPFRVATIDWERNELAV